MNLPEQNCSFCEGHIARRHVRIDDRVVCPSREMMKHNLRQFYCEGFHKPAEVTAERLGLELALPEKPLLERLIERGHETEETPPVNLPPVGPWDPQFLRDSRSPSEATEDNAPTLLADSDGETIRHGSAFEYWSRVTATLGTNGIVREPLEVSGTDEDRRSSPAVHSDGIEKFQNIISTFKSKTTAIAFPIHPQNIPTVQEAVAYDGFQSVTMGPISPADLPVIVIGRHPEALRQFTQSRRDSRTFYLAFIILLLVTLLVFMAFRLADMRA